MNLKTNINQKISNKHALIHRVHKKLSDGLLSYNFIRFSQLPIKCGTSL